VLTPPDRSVLVKRVSRETAAVIMRAMSPDSDKRFQTAGELATALTETARARKRRGWRRRGIAAACALAVGVPLMALWARRDPLDPNLIAVAPFDAEAPSLALWKEGLVDVLSRNFDGAGALRAVPATIVVRKMHVFQRSAEDSRRLSQHLRGAVDGGRSDLLIPRRNNGLRSGGPRGDLFARRA
jgi:serine/threonine-protein kinase